MTEMVDADVDPRIGERVKRWADALFGELERLGRGKGKRRKGKATNKSSK